MADQVSVDSLNWALLHIEKFGDTDLFPPLFEFELVRRRWSDFLSVLSRINIQDYKWHTPRQWLIPKDQISFRTGTQLYPIDAIVFTAWIYDCASSIESLRV